MPCPLIPTGLGGMSSKRITINKILSNESLVQENQYFQVRGGAGAQRLLGGVGQRAPGTVSDVASHILGASIGNGQGFRTHDGRKNLSEHWLQPPCLTPVLQPGAKG